MQNLPFSGSRPPQGAAQPGLRSVPRAVDLRGITAMQGRQRAAPVQPPHAVGALVWHRLHAR